MSRHPPRAVHRAGLLAGAAAVLFAACDGNGPLQPSIESVELTSAIDTVIPVGATAQLTAVALDGGGDVVSGATFDWSSSAPAIASVGASGEVLAVSAGRATITATARTGDVAGPSASGSLPVRVLAADIEGMSVLLDDPVVGHFSDPLGAPKSAVQTALGECDAGLTSGNLVKVITCIETIRDEAESATDGSDRVLLGSLGLVTDFAARKLNR